MAQTGAIDPVQHNAPARSKANRARQSSNFAAALAETSELSKSKIENRANNERPSRAENRDALKHLPDSTPARKADRTRPHKRDENPDAAATQHDRKTDEKTSPPAQVVKSDDPPQAGKKVDADEPSTPLDDNTTDEQKEVAQDTPTEINLPQQILNPDTPETLSPPAPIRTPQQHSSSEEETHHAEGRNVDLEIDVTTPSSSKAAKSSHHVEILKPADVDGAIQPETEAVTDKEPALAEEHNKPTEKPAGKNEAALPATDPVEKSSSKADAPKLNTHSEMGTPSAAASGSHHAINNHLMPDPASTPFALPPTMPDSAKANPVPFHALPIEIGLRALDGAKEITIDLTPKELGQLNIRISVDDQSAIQVSIVTDKPQTLALLQHDASHIRHALEQAGYSTQDNSLQFSLQNNMSSNSNSSRDEQRKPSLRQASRSDLESGEIEVTAPIRQRIHLNQLDLSV